LVRFGHGAAHVFESSRFLCFLWRGVITGQQEVRKKKEEDNSKAGVALTLA
jgi:hypothetical protein